MAYSLSLVLFDRGENSPAAAKQIWPELRYKSINKPFNGHVLFSSHVTEAFDWATRLPTRQHEITLQLRQSLAEFSRDYPDTTFVLIEVDCFGGNCSYKGYVAKQGKILDVAEGNRGEGALRVLVSYLGIQLPADEYCELLERSFLEA